MKLDTTRQPAASTGRKGRHLIGPHLLGLGLLAGGALLALHLYVAFAMPGPWVVMVDEAGYLGNTYHLVHGSGATDAGYYAGYSILLVPSLLLTDDQLSFYRMALVTNALLATSVFPMLYWFVRRVVPGTTSGGALGAAFVTSLFPALLVGPGLVLSEAATIPVFVATACLVVAASETRHAWLWIAAGATAGYLTWVNPRGYFVVPGLLVALVLACRPLRDHIAAWAGAAGTLGVVVVLGRLLNSALPAGGSTPGARGGVLAPFERALSIEGAQDAAGRFFGHGFYVMAASAGLALLGLAALVAFALQAWRRPDGATVAAAFVALPFVALWVLVAMRLSSNRILFRADFLYYGRYLENFVAPVIAVGLALFFTDQLPSVVRRVRDFGWLLAPLVILSFAAGASAFRLPLWVNAPRDFFAHALSFEIYHELLGDISFRRYAVLGAGLSFVVLATLRLRSELGAIVAAVLLLVSAAHAFEEHMLVIARDRDVRVEIPAGIQRLEREGVDVSCISHDFEGIGGSILDAYQFLLPESEFVAVSSDRAEPLCGETILTSRAALDAIYPGARFVVTENGASVSLWVVPSPTTAGS